MIPSVISAQVQRGIEDFLRTTFPPSNPFFHGILERLFADRAQLFKGPYISVKLPFRPGAISRDYFEPFDMGLGPFLHQERAFRRLSGEEPRSTIISTGTGSGKTECFLFPILEYCWRHRGEPGIKAIIIYPMNALANDQAKRIARFVDSNEMLKGNVTAGLFVGDNPDGKGQMTMSPDMILTHKETIRNSPPDILLTNYKMLDYLLIRPVDLRLWRNNGPATLKHLVVDELHTFDGAQGTDLACLIRRVKERVKTPGAFLCCTGTSATLGGNDDLDDLRRYSADLFGESFEDESVVTEDLLSPAEFFGNSFITRSGTVEPGRLAELDPDRYTGFRDYVVGQYKAWFEKDVAQDHNEWEVALGDDLMQHAFFRNLILVLNNQTLSLDDVMARIGKIEPSLRNADARFSALLVNSMLALVSAARLKNEAKLTPFLNVRIQFWMRELRRIVASVRPEPMIRFSDDLRAEERGNHLPLIHCRECGAMGWAAIKRQNDDRFESDLQKFYQGFFNYSPNIHFVFPETDARPGEQREFGEYLCGTCLHAGAGKPPEKCPACGSDDALLAVDIHNTRIKNARNDHVYGTHDCPFCQSHESLTILGSRAASLLAVVIGQLFNSTYYDADDKKLLAFSDSVQDASHRAGFFEARTFRFNFRTALQQVVHSLAERIPLSALPSEFVKYWRARMALPDYVATFLAPNMAWFDDYEYLVKEGKLPDDSTLVADVEKRIAWEILGEYGFTARIGRTLEKTGCSIAYPDPERLQKAAELLAEQLRNEIGGWTSLSATDVMPFLTGIIAQLRTRGALDHPALAGYIRSWGAYYILSRIPFMPNFGKHSRTPALLTTKRGTRFDALLGSGTTESWYQYWLGRLLAPFNPQIGSYAEHAYRITLECLVEQGLMKICGGLSHPVWTLAPDGLIVSRKVDQYRCDHCGFLASAAAEEQAVWENMPCRRFRCPGHYTLQPAAEDYYGRLYSKGEVRRIFAAEHTGLLTRETREKLEERFIHQDTPASANLLSCTPTLEMGINIGDLSTVLLCSVPPSQANYLQRIGRSGRRDGNAFNFAMAEGRPHDLYFFTTPTEMLAGAVTTPGVFLNAPAVLERQFVGFCFDRWIEEDLKPADLPSKLGQVLTNLTRTEDKSLFPFNWLDYIDSRRTALRDRFTGVFADALTEASRAHLANFIEGSGEDESSLVYKVTNRLHGLAKEREDLRRRVQRVNKVIKEKEAGPAKDRNTEEELAELKMEKSAINKIIAGINDKDTFNFFTDEGLLPNYAFPEAGVLLRSIIFRKKKVPDKHGKYDTRVYEYERPAATAIHELAPANTFYAEKRKVQIDRVNLELSEIEEWRFCNQCPHAVPEVLNTHKDACPMCGSVMWADESQKRRMVRLRQVEATTSERDSQVDDSSENRDPQFYNKHMLVDADKRFVEKAYRLEGDEMPFGFEFLRKAEFREINFGQQTGIGETLQIAGAEVPAEGFMLCKACGKVYSERRECKHAITCRYHGKENESQFLDFLYLYRQFSSEAVRILLPVTSFGVSVKLHSFVAALYLGLKEKFKGSIDHLQTAIIEEPVKDTTVKKQFLVLYDRVPGGTGYLKELTKSGAAMMELLELAMNALRVCRCQEDPNKDGCYHCLYAFRMSRDLADISRTEAMGMLAAILEGKEAIIEIDTVSDISVNALFDSELEARFIEALRRAKPGGEPARLSREVVSGKPGWYLQMKGGAYRIEPQVTVTEADGVAVASKPDFVFYPERSDQGLPIAVFTDGFAYHADVRAGHLRVGQDMAQRMALIRSGKFRVWSLSWRDVESRFNSSGNSYFNNLTNSKKTGMQKLFVAYDEQYGSKRLSGVADENAFDGLLSYLTMPDTRLWELYSFILAISYSRSQIAFCDEESADRALKTVMSENTWDGLAFPPVTPGGSGSWFSGSWQLRDKTGRTLAAMATSGRRDVLRPDSLDECSVALRLFDDQDLAESEGFQSAWNGFLHFSNLIQFLPSVQLVTTRGLIEHMYSMLPESSAQIAVTAGTSQVLTKEYEELIRLTDPLVHELIKTMVHAGKMLPEPGFELEGDRGEVIATAELAWPSHKTVIVLPGNTCDGDIFMQKQWNVLSLEEFERGLLLNVLPENNV